jgi:hypothetical protein
MYRSMTRRILLKLLLSTDGSVGFEIISAFGYIALLYGCSRNVQDNSMIFIFWLDLFSSTKDKE